MPVREDDEEERLKYTGQALLVYMLPIIMIGALGSVAAWVVARRGAPRVVVRVLNFPAVFATSNFIGASVVVAVCFIYYVFKDGARMMPYERLADYLDLTRTWSGDRSSTGAGTSICLCLPTCRGSLGGTSRSFERAYGLRSGAPWSDGWLPSS